MKITHNKVGQNLNLVDTNKADRSEAAKAGKTQSSKPSLLEASAQSDATKVDVSGRAMEAKRIKDLAMAAPDVDMAKVEKFRKLIDEGNYKVDAKSVADKMVDDHMEMMGPQE